MRGRATIGRAGTALLAGASVALALFPVSTADAQVSTSPVLQPWSATSGLPEARSRAGATAANGFVYLLGGVNSAGTTVATSFYAPLNADGTLGAWSTTTPLPAPRRTVRPAIWGSTIFLAGGNTGADFQSTVLTATINPDGTLGAWNTTTPLPVAQTAHSTLAYNGFLYIVGGNTGSTCIGTVRYAAINPDGTLGAWNTTAALPAPRCGNVEAVTVANGFLYAAGGFDNNDVTSALFYAPINADGTLGAWQTNVGGLTVGREYHGLEALNGYLYAIGGQADVNGTTGGSDAVEYAALNADGSAGPFTATTSLPADRGDLATEVVNGRVFALGGGTGASGADPQPTVLVSSQAPADVTAPSVALASPLDGSAVSGVVEVAAVASDDTGVAAVQLLLDGAPLGPELTGAPYAIPWDTSTAVNGSHSLAASARDAAGNRSVSPAITVMVANNNVTAAYGMESGTGTTLVDSSPNGFHAEAVDPVWNAAGRYGLAVDFNGVTTRARTTVDVTLGSAWTFEAWVSNPTNEAYETILTVGEERDLYLSDGQLSFYGDGASTTFGPVGTDGWQHVALTYDGSALRAFVNGAPLGAESPAALAPTSAPLQLGAWMMGDASYDFFAGTLDEVRITSRALSVDELLVNLSTPVAAAGQVPPDTTTPDTTTADSTVPDTTTPDTTTPDSTVPDTTTPGTTSPESTVPDTTTPATTAPDTTVPDTTTPATTSPPDTAPSDTTTPATTTDTTSPPDTSG